MTVEEKLEKIGMEVPSLEDLYRTNLSGARYISHFPVQNLLYLSGTTPRKDGQPYLPGVVGKDLTVAQGYEAARYAALTTLAAVKYALGDLDRVQQISLRSVPISSGAVPSDRSAENLAAFGTLIVLDGVPLSNNANLQSLGSRSDLSFSTSAGGGVDLRRIPAATIERGSLARMCARANAAPRHALRACAASGIATPASSTAPPSSSCAVGNVPNSVKEIASVSAGALSEDKASATSSASS